MYKKEIDCIKKAGEFAEYHGIPFAILGKGSDGFDCICVDCISTLDDIIAVVLSDGSFQRLGSYVVRNVKED